jgi:predicted Rossmann fold flavoprotein
MLLMTVENAPAYDVLVLGAGAAGLVAAIRAAEMGRRVLVLEKNRRAGVKILMSGGTRCNITNARGLRSLRGVSGPIDPGYDPKRAKGARSIQAGFTAEAGAFLGPALRSFSVEDSVALFEDEGLATKVEANGKVFPATDRATDVLAALLARLERSGATLRPSCPALGLERGEDGLFRVRTPDRTIAAASVILTTGGQSYPGCGTTGDAYAWAAALGHGIVRPRPALVPLRTDAAWVLDLKGITLPDVEARVVGPGGDGGGPRARRREAVLFAHFGVTGPAALDVSREVARAQDATAMRLDLDLVPDLKIEPLDASLQSLARAGSKKVAYLLPPALPQRVADAVLARAGVPADRRGPELSRDERRRLVATLKALPIPLTGTLDFAKAEVTAGGVALDSVDPATMQSRACPGLFLAGEVLDLDGLIGGYNFQAAWSTGWLAGQSAAEHAARVARKIPSP